MRFPGAFGRALFAATWIGLLVPLQAADSLQVRAVTEQGKPIPWPPGTELRLDAAPQSVGFRFEPPSNGVAAPARLRYKLEGRDTAWQESQAFMSLTVRFWDKANQRVSQTTFTNSGNSSGWDGRLESSTLTHRKETLTVPAGAATVQVVISSAGPPDAVGVFVVNNLVLSGISADGNREILIRYPAESNPGGLAKDQIVGWNRDGLRPGMAKIVELGTNGQTEALAIVDNDLLGHAEWRSQREKTPPLVAGENLALEWDEMFSIAKGGNPGTNYVALAPGHYLFRLQGENVYGAPAGGEVSATVYVAPPVWERPWFLAMAGLAAVGISAAGTRYYSSRIMRRSVALLQQQQALERERLRIAQDIHDDLGARVTQISLVSAMAQGNDAFPAKAQAEFDRISRMSRELVSALYETVWTVNPENDNLDAVATFLCQKINELCSQAELKCRLHIVDLPQDIQISSQARHNICMAVKEAVHNVIKHAHASFVTVRVDFARMLLAITVQDDGCGFDFSSATAGHGLVNLKRRMESIGGKCSVDSALGSGTTVRIELALKTIGEEPKTVPPARPPASSSTNTPADESPIYEEVSRGS